MPYGNSIPIKNAGRVMEQFVKIVVPRGTQSTYMTNGGALAGKFCAMFILVKLNKNKSEDTE